MGSPVPTAGPAPWHREVPIRQFFAWLWRGKVGLAIGAGLWFRLAQYLTGRNFWQDEAALVLNVVRLSPAGFFGPLQFQQLAPPGFLVAQWVSGRLLGHGPGAMQLVPLLAGTASLFLFLGVARRCLPPRAVFPAVVMFACSDDLISFASEAKQYSSDVTCSLACLLLGLTVGSRPLTPTRTAALAAWGAAIVWFSHPAIFALATIGVLGLHRAAAARDRRGAALWLLVGTAWVLGFLVVHVVAIRQLGKDTQMWPFWAFAFPQMPHSSAWEATWVLRRLAYFFVNPLSFDHPFGPRISMLPAIALALFGSYRLWKLDRSHFFLVVLPVAFALLASCLKAYPFHGRLVLFLAPSPLIAIAAGLDGVRGPRWWGVLHAGLAAMVVAVPAVTATYHLLESRESGHNFVGDRRPSSLDPLRFPF